MDKNHNKTGGRKPGSVNKCNFLARKMAEEMGVDPLEFLLKVVRGDVSDATIDHQIAAAKESVKYLYTQLKAVEHSGSIESKPQTLEEFVKQQNENKE